MTPHNSKHISRPVAIIGMGCIFPKSRNLKEFWQLLFNGIDAIEPVPETTHWQLKDYYDADPARPDHTYCTRGGFIPDMAFDPMVYGIPPNNISATDTSQLLGLEVARMALADAGYPMGHAFLQDKKVNVILGVTGTQELVIPLGARLGHPLWKQAMADAGLAPEKTDEILERLDTSYVQWQENSFPGLLGNVVAGRVANRLNLSGTNAVSDAACASSLSAVHTAVMELQTGRCDMSISGGVDTLNDIFMHMCFSKTGVLSHTSDAKPFSKDADGTVLGEGIGMLVLKRLEDAERDKDKIYAVIRSIGTSSDGKTSAIYAPEAKGQIRALEDAYDRAGIDQTSVELIEAHGTGTRVGDKVEFTALKNFFAGSSDQPGIATTAIGSVKSMIGHAKAAAGAAGLIKSALALHHKVLPPTLKASEPDPELEINASAFYLNDRAKPWIARNGKDSLRRSGVSAFGFGGSNFHAVLEEYGPEKQHVSWDGSVQILALSGKDRSNLKQDLEAIKAVISACDPKDKAELNQALAWQAHESRQKFKAADPVRVLILIARSDGPDFSFSTVDDLLDQAVAAVDGNRPAKAPVFFGTGAPKGKLGFVFPGQGSQYTGMARDLISIFPEAMQAFALAEHSHAKETGDSGQSLGRYAFPLPGHAIDKKAAEEALRKTDVAQPAIGGVSMAMAGILNRFGIKPDMACGHSFGELSALCAAGWLTPKAFTALAASRGRHMAAAGRAGDDPGSMLAVQAPIDDIKTLVATSDLDLILANVNSPVQGVLSGSTREIDKAFALCKTRKMRAVKLPVAAAFHSDLVEDAALPFEKTVTQKKLTPTGVQVLSNTTGGFYPTSAKAAKQVLGRQLVHPVNFTDNIEAMYDNGISTFVEVGPKSVLTGLIKSILKDRPFHACAMDASAGKKPGLFDLAATLCFTAAMGHDVDLTAWEEPAQAPSTKKMKIMLSGANPKPVKKPVSRVTPMDLPADAPRTIEAPGHTRIPDNPQTPAAVKPLETVQCHTPRGNTMTPSQHACKKSVSAQPAPAGGTHMDILSKGLEAIQQLQAQTARAHEKFLETQAMAGQSLAMMLEQTRGVAPQPMTPLVAPTNFQPPAAAPAAAPAFTQTALNPPALVQAESVQTAPVESQIQPPIHPVDPPAQMAPVNRVKDTAGVTTVEPAGHPAELPVPQGVSNTQAILFDTVSRLTGFPVEMLEPDMDIESDLGIDSIKKVEIISELERQIPGCQSASPEVLSTVRSLADICRAMDAEDKDTSDAGTINTAPQTEPSAPAPSKPQADAAGEASSAANSGQTYEVLVNIISELTGFPTQMLEPEMNLESDLGVDSIKRVEILSRLEQELPDTRGVSPDEMGTLKTLEDIVTYLAPDSEQTAPAADPETGASQPTAKKKLRMKA